MAASWMSPWSNVPITYEQGVWVRWGRFAEDFLVLHIRTELRVRLPFLQEDLDRDLFNVMAREIGALGRVRTLPATPAEARPPPAPPGRPEQPFAVPPPPPTRPSLFGTPAQYRAHLASFGVSPAEAEVRLGPPPAAPAPAPETNPGTEQRQYFYLPDGSRVYTEEF